MDGRPWQWGVLRLVTRMRNGGNLTGRIRTVLRGGTVSYRAIAWNAQTGGWTVDGRHARGFFFFFGEERDEFRTTGQRSNADHRRRQQHRCATSARYHDPMLHVDISKHSRSQPHRILLPRHVLACGNATRTTTPPPPPPPLNIASRFLSLGFGERRCLFQPCRANRLARPGPRGKRVRFERTRRRLCWRRTTWLSQDNRECQVGWRRWVGGWHPAAEPLVSSPSSFAIAVQPLSVLAERVRIDDTNGR